MPIYAYKCGSCGHAKDVLQKISDAPLTVCPACGAEAFSKQVTAAGFQLKGSGWYVTDFRGGNSGGGGTSAPATDTKTDSAPAAASATGTGDAPKKEAASPSTASAGSSSSSSTSSTS
ncbi:FmdB family zinc ribbon protein [Acidovorax sp. sic0104]|jgi:putative FmdB family regulatory protein|uniref:FmdB family zinc ribbon protein n=1 Tax=Acidovorax sp. sic0104 TaxID=2854784 RepID=UPI001C44E8A7|nr:FmdB family zinc ribbon protein [Acidovorax sp. sic0104]MBV7539895.1 zinc ribbon domain-containing protein [Acidovorax sp. sic0104]